MCVKYMRGNVPVTLRYLIGVNERHVYAVDCVHDLLRISCLRFGSVMMIWCIS